MAERRVINEEEEKGRGGGGNKNGLAYGLLKGAGYNTDGMSPGDAWALVDALKLMDRQRQRKTDDDEKSYKSGNEDAKRRGVNKDSVVQSAGKISQRVAIHTNNTAGAEKAIQTATAIMKEYGLDKLMKIQTKQHLGGGIISAAASACGGELNISSTFLRNPEAFVRSSNRFRENNAATIANLKASREKAAERGKIFLQERLDKQIEQLERKGQYTRHNVVREGHAVEDVISHEMGHIIADQLFGQINGGRFLKTGINPAEAQRKRTAVEVSYKNALLNGDIYKVSAYAGTSPAEYFAECFAMKRAGEKLPATAEQMMSEVL